VNDPTTIRASTAPLRPQASAGQAALLEELLPAISVPDEGPIDASPCSEPSGRFTSRSASERGASRFPRRSPARSRLHRREPFLNGVVGALQHVRDKMLTNVRLHMGDALEVLERLPDASLRFVYLLHPDPWPKARHAKRRMVNHGRST
jgi:tRNA (guanine-N7-)-methyltransferase